MAIEELTQRSATEVLRDTDRNSVGVVRVLSSTAGTAGQEREYEAGDEALVEAGQAEWVVAPVHLPAAGRRLDTDAERGPTPLGGIEAYPPAEPTTAARRSQARIEGSVEAHADDDVATKIAAKRAGVAKAAATAGGVDVKAQTEFGGRSARSGPITAASDLPADLPADQPAGQPVDQSTSVGRDAAAKPAKGKE